jgi:hypothetical protein
MPAVAAERVGGLDESILLTLSCSSRSARASPTTERLLRSEASVLGRAAKLKSEAEKRRPRRRSWGLRRGVATFRLTIGLTGLDDQRERSRAEPRKNSSWQTRQGTHVSSSVIFSRSSRWGSQSPISTLCVLIVASHVSLPEKRRRCQRRLIRLT